MKKRISILIVFVLALITAIFANVFLLQADDTTDYLSVDKTEYAKSDTIYVTVNALPEDKTNLWIVLYPYPYTIGSTTGGVWIDVAKDGVNVGDTVEITQNATTGFGAFSVSLLYYKTNGTLEDNVIHVGPSLKPTKDVYAPGEDIIINYNNITTDLGDCWLGLYKQDQAYTTQNQKWCWGIHSGANELGAQSGTFKVQDMTAGQMTGALPEGEYKIVLLLNSNKKELSNVAYFTVEAPKPELAASKSEYTVGEEIIINYSNITADLGDCWLGLLKGDELNTARSSKERYAVQNGVNLLGSDSGSFSMDTFPDKLIFGVLPEGEYKVILFRLSDRAELSNVANFTVTSPFESIQPELTNSIALHYAVELGDSITSDVAMTFTMNEESVDVPGTLDDGLWKFTFDGILPQDMGVVVQSDLYIGGVKKASYAYSVAEYCYKQLEKTTGTTEKENAFRALLVAMLNYGTEAQKYFDQAVDSYVNDGVEQTYLTRYNYTVDQATNRLNVDKDVNTGDFIWKTATLGLYDEIKIRIKFYAVTTDNLTVMVNGEAYTEFTPCGTNLYYVHIPVSAHQFDAALQIAFDQNGSTVGAPLTYSVNSYINYAKDITSVCDLVDAIYQYGCSAQYYVSQQ